MEREGNWKVCPTLILLIPNNKRQSIPMIKSFGLSTRKNDEQGEWPSGPANSISLTEVKHRCVRSETGWATFQMNDQNSSLSRPSEGTLN